MPEFLVRVPGRVNLIGEHIDYCGYAVLPMAIDQDIIVGAQPRNDSIVAFSNVNHNYQDYWFDANNFCIDRGTPFWYKYALCGVKGVLDRHLKPASGWRGANLLFEGCIPPSAGLSSSSALVCSTALLTAHNNNLNPTKKTLAEMCAQSERHIGTEGGGMDQAIAFLASQGTAKLIEFNPLCCHDVQLPSGAVFVIANCLAEANKAVGSEFNCRVVECNLAAQVLAVMHGVDGTCITNLSQLQFSMRKTLPEMAAIVQTTLHKEPFSKEELASLIGLTVSELEERFMPDNTRHIEEFKLHQRALHVYEEANRVWRFKEICDQSSEKNIDQTTALKELGCLMMDSHRSCRDLYECSHPKLDELVDLANQQSMGARLTGAGWGGCMVAIVAPNKVKSLIEHLKVHFYQQLEAAAGRDLKTVVFPTQPGGGAVIYQTTK